MADIKTLIEGLTDRDNANAYGNLKELLKMSAEAEGVYAFFDSFVLLLDSDNSYVRSRALELISANARWDRDCKIDEIIDEYLKHILDDKPITSRQCIKALPEIACRKPELRDDIKRALGSANPARYKDSMRSLVQRDIQQALEKIERMN